MDSSAGMRSKIEPSPTSSQGIEPGDPRPRRVARDEVDLGEERRPVTLGELAALQGQQRVLVGHRRQAEARAAVAEVAAVVDRVVAVVARALRPRPAVRRHDADRPPAGALERPREGEAVVLDELVVPPLAVDPDPRLQGGVRQPAEAAERRRGEEGAARGEAGGPQLRGAPVEHGARCGARTTSPGPRPSRSSRRTRAGRPCPAGRSAAGRREWRGSGRGRSGGRAPRDPPGRSAPPAPRRRPGRRRSRRRPARRRRGGPPRPRPAPPPPGAPSRGGRPRPASRAAAPGPGGRGARR